MNDVFKIGTLATVGVLNLLTGGILLARPNTEASDDVKAQALELVTNQQTPTRVSVSDIGSGTTAGDKMCIVTVPLGDSGTVRAKLSFMPSRNNSVIRRNDEHFNNKLNEFFTVSGYKQGERKPYIILSAHRDDDKVRVCLGGGCLIGMGKKFTLDSSDGSSDVVGSFNSLIKNYTEACKKEAIEQATKGTATDLDVSPSH